MTTLFVITVIILLLIQYVLVIGALIQEEIFESMIDSIFFLIPIIPIILFIVIGIHELLFNKETRSDLMYSIKKLKNKN